MIMLPDPTDVMPTRKPGHQADQRHAHKTLCCRRAIGDTIFDFFLQQQQRGNHDQQDAHGGFNEAVHSVAIKVADMHQQFHADDRAWNAPHRQRDHHLAAHRIFLQVQKAGWDFREEIEQRVRAHRHDRRHLQTKNQNREQQNAASDACHADEHADNKANQNFRR